MRNLKYKYPVIIGLVAFLACITLVANGGLSFKDKIAQVAGEILGNRMYEDVKEEPVEEEPTLGASASTLNRWTDQNGLVTWVVSGEFDSSSEASTTLISFLNPIYYNQATNTSDGALAYNKTDVWNGSTSTIDLASIVYDGTATSSFEIQCGASEDPYSAPTYDIINTEGHGGALGGTDNAISTSTPALVENGIAYNAGSGVIPTGTTTQILLTPNYPYVTCTVTSTADDWAFFGENQLIGSTSLLDGKYKFRIYTNQY